MGYPCTGCQRVGRWSNPDVVYNGAPTGVTNYADNARSLNNTRAITAAFRKPVVQPPNDIAEMVSPLDGATLASDTVTFVWDDAGALAYRLEVGTSVGDASIHSSLYGVNTSASVGGLPSDGSDVYVRLSSESHAVGWQTRDYHYSAWLAPFTPAWITSPVPGSTLTGADVTFSWDAAPQARRYVLHVGTAEDPQRYFSESLDLNQSCRVAGLPTDGREIVATLDTEGPTTTESTQAIYNAFTEPNGGSPFTSPQAGSTLLGSSARFTWLDSGALQYWIAVQRSDGSYVFSGSVGTATEFTVIGLPTDGSTLQVTLFEQLVPSWVERASAFVAASR
jgi:hypothetical protein